MKLVALAGAAVALAVIVALWGFTDCITRFFDALMLFR